MSPALLRAMRNTVGHGVSGGEASACSIPESKALRWHGAIQLLAALEQADFAEVYIRDRSEVSQPLRPAAPVFVLTHRAHTTS